MDKEKRLNEIEERISRLKDQTGMWAKNGGTGGNMAMKAQIEIKLLEAEYNDLKYGTHRKELEDLRYELERARGGTTAYEHDLDRAHFYNRKFRQKKYDEAKEREQTIKNRIEELESLDKKIMEGKEEKTLHM